MPAAIVTGGGGGIGGAIARALGKAGYRVGVLDAQASPAQAVAATIPGAVAFAADVTDEASVAAALKDFGPVDLLVNAAGIMKKGLLLDQSVADFRRMLDINLIGAFVMLKAVGPGMMARRSGTIINITSIAGIQANSEGGAYGPSKAGLANLTTQMALELAPHGIRVNAIAPGMIAAGMAAAAAADPQVRAARAAKIPAGDLGTAEHIADAVLFLASDAARYIHGHQLVVDGAVTQSVLANLPIPKA